MRLVVGSLACWLRSHQSHDFGALDDGGLEESSPVQKYLDKLAMRESLSDIFFAARERLRCAATVHACVDAFQTTLRMIRQLLGVDHGRASRSHVPIMRRFVPCVALSLWGLGARTDL